MWLYLAVLHNPSKMCGFFPSFPFLSLLECSFRKETMKSSVQFSSIAQSCPTLCVEASRRSLQNLLKQNSPSVPPNQTRKCTAVEELL